MPIERPNVTSYELAITMCVPHVIVCKIFTVKMWMTLTIKMGQVKYRYANRKLMPLFMLPIAILPYLSQFQICHQDQMQICQSKVHATFCVGITIHEIIMHELPNTLDFNLWPWKWSRTLTIWRKIAGELTLLTCIIYIKNGASGSSRLLPMHFVMDERTNMFRNCRQ